MVPSNIILINFEGGEIILKDLNEIVIQNPEPYRSILEFINTQVIPKYPCLTYCFQDNFDEEGNPRIQYYIRYAADLTVKQSNDLFLKILNDIKNFCFDSGIAYDENLGVDFILTVDGDFVAKKDG